MDMSFSIPEGRRYYNDERTRYLSLNDCANVSVGFRVLDIMIDTLCMADPLRVRSDSYLPPLC
jgi:hypothetical protein